MQSKPRASILLLPMVLLAACATLESTNTINHASEFAQAGITFANSIDPVLDDSLKAKIQANSMTLARGRSNSLDICAGDAQCLEDTQTDLEQALTKQTEKERQRVELYRRFRAHTQVLRNYFQTLSSLAKSDQPDTLGQSAQRLVEQASTLRQDILAVQPLDVGNVPTILATQVANTFRSKALQNTLKKTAPAISIELNLQEALLTNLAEQTNADLSLAFQADDDKNINDPYIASTAPLPADWADKRLASAKRSLALTSVDAARKAAGTLRTAFEALSENRLDPAMLGGLIQDLDNLATLALEVHRVKNNDSDGGEE